MIFVTLMADLTTLSIVSYDCRGCNAIKSNCIKTLLAKVTCLFLQELWLSDNQLHCLDDIDNNHLSTGVSGFENTEVLSGRPYGGCAILWRSDINATVEVINTDSRRIYGIRIVTASFRLITECVYAL